MKKAILTTFAILTIAASANGCAYGGIGAVGDKAVVTRNDAFLFGILRKVFVCKVTDGGLASCQSAEAP
jgi:hypothetical protein